MKEISYIERELSDDELTRVWAGFRENEIEHTGVHHTSERISFVLVKGHTVIGCSTGLAYKKGDTYTGWFYLTDLFIEKKYRGMGYGKTILKKLEKKLLSLNITKIRVWTAQFEAAEFYKKQGYLQISELEIITQVVLVELD